MKILLLAHFYPPEMGGAAARLHGLGRWLAAYGHEVTVVTGFPNYPSGLIPQAYRSKLWTVRELDGVHVIETWVYASPRRGRTERLANYFSFVVSSIVAALLRHKQYDVVLASSPPLFLGLSGWIISRVQRVPFVFDIRDIWPDVAVEAGDFAPDAAITRLGYSLARFLYARADHITPVTHSKRRKIIAVGAAPEKVTVVCNGVDLDLVAKGNGACDKRAELGLGDQFIVLYAGLIGLAQGVEIAVHAAQQLQSRQDIRFVIVGDGVRREAIAREVKQLGLANVMLLPRQPREKIPAFLSMADVCLVPLVSSRLEDAVPSKLLEAWAHRRPVILAAGGEAAEIVRESQGGLVVPPEEPQQLVDSVLHLKEQPELLVKFADHGYRFVSEHFDRRQLALAMEGVLQRAVSERQAQRRKPLLADIEPQHHHLFPTRRRIDTTSRNSHHLRSLLLLSRRAGLRRCLHRIRRHLQHQLIDPRLAKRLYPLPVLDSHTPQGASAAQRGVLQRLVHLRHPGTRPTFDTARRELYLLNQPPLSLIPPLDWQEPISAEPLWTFRLHGWEWAWPALGDDELARQHFLQLWQDWLAQVPFGRATAWQAHPTSRRLVVWATAWHLCKGGVRAAAEIARGAAYLARHLEYDLDNNHLVANAKALAWVGLLFPWLPAAARWRALGLRTLWAALQAQVGHDGGHCEHSTSYHLEVWRDGLETALLCQATGVAVPSGVLALLERMGEFALALCRPDGRLPLLNDSIEDEPAPLSALFRLASVLFPRPDFCWLAGDPMAEKPAQGNYVLADSGYVVVRPQTDSYLLFDAGDLGPAHCPGHGHADTLSVEFWARGQPLFIDPGTFQYAHGPWRDYFRGTAAHSTATVDRLDQSRFAGAFRVADLAHGRLLHADIASADWEVIGEHDGYTRLQEPVLHRRRVAGGHDGEILMEDCFLGRGTHRIALRWHLAPSRLDVTGTHAKVTYPSGLRLQINVEGEAPGRLAPEKGWYSRTWYRKEAVPVLAYEIEAAELPLVVKTTLKTEK